MTQIDFKVDMADMERIRKKLGVDLIADPMRSFFNKAVIAVQSKGRERAPVDTGRMVNSLATEVDRARLPLWGKVGTNVKSKRGFLYPAALDASPIYHYRGGKSQGRVSARAVVQGKTRGGAGGSMGSPTKGWFSDVPALLRTKVQGFVRDMGREIAARFDKR